jgi:dipeptidase E
MKKQLFLISSSRCQGGKYLAHCAQSLKEFLGPMDKDEKIAFVPYALKDWDGYTAIAQEAFAEMGYNLISVHDSMMPHGVITDQMVRAVFVGGGNIFRLLRALHDWKMFKTIANYVNNGTIKYIGSSAGSNMAGPTIKTTNDMPIVLPPDFNALNLVKFQINPHFVPGCLVPNHMGETRETRIKEYHEENDLPVVGLTETNWLTVDGETITLHGDKEAFIFTKRKEVMMWQPGVQKIVGTELVF